MNYPKEAGTQGKSGTSEFPHISQDTDLDERANNLMF